MAPRKKKTAAGTAAPGVSSAARTAIQETAKRVEEMHGAIADQSFAVLAHIPLLSGPAQLVRLAHDSIARGVYAAVHHGTGVALEAAALIERQQAQASAEAAPGRLASGVRSALNSAFGDHLAASDNTLAIPMAIHVDGRPVALDAAALAAAFPAAGERIGLFIHGLGCDEYTWECAQPAADGECDFGRQLQADFAITPLYLRYNTGLPIERNGELLAALLEDLHAAWPQADSTIVIIGHSMGGLVALAAIDQAVTAAMRWPAATRMLVCLGSPHLGSPLERLGHLAHSLMNQTAVTAPLGKIAGVRSQGIKDLRHGPGAPAMAHAPAIAYRFLGASLAGDADHPLAEWLGDGLVPLASATSHAIEGDVETATVGNLGHMALVTDTRVYGRIRDWLAATDAARG
jgi:pimeloyl-ACP methyl ester carboxylesterase